MRVFVIDSGIKIAPFGDLVRDCDIGGIALHQRQEGLFRRFGLELVRVESERDIPSGEARVVTYDHVFFTRRVIKSFLERWKRAGSVASRLALPAKSTFIERFSALQQLEITGEHALFDLWALPAGATAADARPLEVIYKERVLEIPVPRRISAADSWIHPITSSVVFHVRHWLHVLQASLLSIQIRWVDEVITHPLWGLSLLARASVGRGRFMWRLGGVANRFGKGVDVHPTARVEGSFLGDGVIVGPHALVRGAIIGAGTVIEQAADVSYSVIGKRSFVSKHSILWAVAAFDEAELCMKGMQMCMVGKKSSLTARATPMDTIPGRTIKLKDGDQFVDSGMAVIGACFGHETFIGADVYIGPGREIPNGTRIMPDPSRVLTRVPRDLVPGKMYVIREGTLVALD